MPARSRPAKYFCQSAELIAVLPKEIIVLLNCLPPWSSCWQGSRPAKGIVKNTQK